MQPLSQALQEYPEQALPYAQIHSLQEVPPPRHTVQMSIRLGAPVLKALSPIPLVRHRSIVARKGIAGICVGAAGGRGGYSPVTLAGGWIGTRALLRQRHGWNAAGAGDREWTCAQPPRPPASR